MLQIRYTDMAIYHQRMNHQLEILNIKKTMHDFQLKLLFFRFFFILVSLVDDEHENLKCKVLRDS